MALVENGPFDSSVGSSLLLGIRRREPQAWQRLVQLYGPLVYRWCSAAGVPRHDSADVGQEVFRAVAAGIDRFRRDENGHTFVGWIRQITRFKIVDFQRQVANSPAARGGSTFLDVINQLPDGPSEAVASESRAMDEARTVIVARALQILKSHFREHTWRAFWETAVQQRSTSDVAADLDMTEMAVRKAKSRVLGRLRQELGDELPISI
jgi:RNA polymerase sigma-70 factor (ECF subfamily)